MNASDISKSESEYNTRAHVAYIVIDTHTDTQVGGTYKSRWTARTAADQLGDERYTVKQA